MGIKKFIQNVAESLGLDEFKKSSKKKSIKSLLKKLNAKKKATESLTKTKANKKDIEEELKLLTFQIKKGEKILTKLNA